MSSVRWVEIECDHVVSRPDLGLKSIVQFSVEYIVRRIIDSGNGDLRAICEGEIMHHKMCIGPDTDIRRALKDRFGTEDDVLEPLSSRIAHLLDESGSVSMLMSLSVKVVEERVHEDYDENDSELLATLVEWEEEEEEEEDEEQGMGLMDLIMEVLAVEDEEEGEEERIQRANGASEDAITRLKKEGETKARNLKMNKLESDNCVVCMEQFSDSDTIINMPCSHVFHQGCILEWLQTHNTCPLCRRVPYESLSSRDQELAPK